MKSICTNFIFLLLAVNVSAQCWQQVAKGVNHWLAIKSDGSLWAWGDSYYGQLGNGTSGMNTYQATPIQIGMAYDWQQVAAGAKHSLAIKSDGSFWSWGHDYEEQLGVGNSTNIPLQLGMAYDWQQVTAGFVHSVAIKNDGALWAWGFNESGQVGNGQHGENRKAAPQPIGTAHDWQQAAAGYFHTVAIKIDGTLWSWGYSSAGQLGNGTAHYTPTQVGTASNWQQVAAGHQHTVAIKSDGSLWAWGLNDRGQLGIGTNIDQYVPLQIDTAHDWQQVTAGYFHTAAIKSDGTLWAWGVGGLAGGGTNIDKNTPAQIDTATDWQRLVAGYYSTMAFKSDGTLWRCGCCGTYEISCPTSGTKNILRLTGSVQISPNPAQDHIIVRTTDINTTGLTFAVRNILGEDIYARQSLHDNQRIELHNLAQGVYLLIVSNQEGQVVRQFVKI